MMAMVLLLMPPPLLVSPLPPSPLPLTVLLSLLVGGVSTTPPSVLRATLGLQGRGSSKEVKVQHGGPQRSWRDDTREDKD